MIASLIYILTSWGWKKIDELTSHDSLFNPDGKVRKIVDFEKRNLSHSENCFDVVLINEDGLSRSVFKVSSDQRFVLSDMCKVQAKDLKKGDQLFQCKMSKEKWFVSSITESTTLVWYRLISEKHFFLINGCYAILGDDSE